MAIISKNYAYLLICLFFLSSCEKTVSFQLNNSETKKLVVDGQIETGKPPIVFLTNAIGVTDPLNLNTVLNSIVRGAIVEVSDATRTIQLIEQNNSYQVAPQDSNFVGVPGQIYKLKIQYLGKVYEASTKIPIVKSLDSIWTVKRINAGGPDSNEVNIFARYTDPDTLGNYVRYFTKRNKEPFFTGRNSVYNDEVINGNGIDVRIEKGYDKINDTSTKKFGNFIIGDTVQVKWCAIEKAVYNFWNTLEFSTNSVGNPFSSPSAIMSNISNGALGVWAGYGTSFKTIIVVK
ncbi:MAG: DUF4249 domain-containing protein [Bacteroidota bacterium]|jgi:hypothetical protein|nr:DUF4249 domain-containing protein [Bacteroidota bacterium]